MTTTEQTACESCDTCGKPTPAEDLFSEQPCGNQVCRGCLEAYLITASTVPYDPQMVVE